MGLVLRVSGLAVSGLGVHCLVFSVWCSVFRIDGVGFKAEGYLNPTVKYQPLSKDCR